MNIVINHFLVRAPEGLRIEIQFESIAMNEK